MLLRIMMMITITTFLNACNVSDTVVLGYCTFINFHDVDSIFPILLKRGWDPERLSKLCKVSN